MPLQSGIQTIQHKAESRNQLSQDQIKPQALPTTRKCILIRHQPTASYPANYFLDYQVRIPMEPHRGWVHIWKEVNKTVDQKKAVQIDAARPEAESPIAGQTGLLSVLHHVAPAGIDLSIILLMTSRRGAAAYWVSTEK